MASSIFQNNQNRNNLNNQNQNNPQQMMQKFNQFKQEMQGKNPKQMVMGMLQNGQIGNSQLQQAMEMAKQFNGMLK